MNPMRGVQTLGHGLRAVPRVLDRANRYVSEVGRSGVSTPHKGNAPSGVVKAKRATQPDVKATTRGNFGCRCEIAAELRVVNHREAVRARKGPDARFVA
jgi:hypothetical protein